MHEIESVLGHAFETTVSSKPCSDVRAVPSPTSKALLSEGMHPVTPLITVASTPVGPVKPRANRSSLFLNRIFGSKSRSDLQACVIPEITPARRRRRPVSAVFSHALHRLSTASIYNKRVSTPKFWSFY